jgi:preprotein translocase subunit SecE
MHGAIGGRDADDMFKTSPAQFVREVRQELAKVTWPPRTELLQMTVMVFLMSALAALFFFGVDQVIALLVKLVLGLGV